MTTNLRVNKIKITSNEWTNDEDVFVYVVTCAEFQVVHVSESYWSHSRRNRGRDPVVFHFWKERPFVSALWRCHVRDIYKRLHDSTNTLGCKCNNRCNSSIEACDYASERSVITTCRGEGKLCATYTRIFATLPDDRSHFISYIISSDSGIQVRKNVDVNAVFLLICILHAMSFNTSGVVSGHWSEKSNTVATDWVFIYNVGSKRAR